MLQSSSHRFIVLGLAMIVIAWLMVFAMILNLVQESFALSFLSYALGLAGFFTGLMGIFSSWSRQKDRKEIQELKEAARNKSDDYVPYFFKMDVEDEDFQEFLESEEERNKSE